eukprot:SAG22_NODE_1376_length_4554_cov_11.791919_5_plen_47_part_00
MDFPHRLAADKAAEEARVAREEKRLREKKELLAELIFEVRKEVREY